MVSCVALGMSMLAQGARAATYTAFNETELRNAITTANGDGDPSSTIRLGASITLTNAAAFPAPTKPLTIDVGSFTMSAQTSAASTNFPGAPTVSVPSGGALQGGTGAAGGTAINLSSGGTITVGGTVTGGLATSAAFGNNGGAGITATNATIIVTSTGVVRGGNQNTNSNTGGIGIVGTNTTIIVEGTVISGAGASGGLAGAIRLINGILELRAGYNLVGNVIGGGANDTVALGGNADAAFDTSLVGFPRWNGIEFLRKTGSSTWTLTGASTAAMRWTLLEGTLSVSADRQLGAASAASTLTFDGGTLRNTAAFSSTPLRATTINAGGGTFETQADLTWTGTIGGVGTLNKIGSEALILTNASNNYSGGTNVLAGTLAVGEASSPTASLTGAGAINVAGGATFGGYGSVTNATINNAGTVAVANAVAPFAAGGNGTFTVRNLNNAAVVMIGGQGIGNQLVVTGSYAGMGGVVALNAQLGGDGSPSDRLVIDGGTASGSSGLMVRNVGGAGAAVAADGIEVITARNGATTGTGFLLGAPVKGGVYQYYLAKGGSTAGTAENWYLRNFIAATAAGTAAPVPSYRPEAPIYSEVANVARVLNFEQVASFRERQPERTRFGETGAPSAAAGASGESSRALSDPERPAWARAWGSRTKLKHEGSTAPEFDGWISGVQIGSDLHVETTPGGARNQYGMYLGFARVSGDAEGFAAGTSNLDVGQLNMNSYSVGGYWTHLGARGWYADTALTGSALRINARSTDGDGARFEGRAFVGSVETGLPLPLGGSVVLEPQVQLVWQHLWLEDFDDGISTVRLEDGNSYRARIGVRLQSIAQLGGVRWQPYASVNLLRSSVKSDATTFSDGTVLETGASQTAAEFSLGTTGNFSKLGGLYATLSYLTDLSGAYQRSVTAKAGVRFTW